MLGSHRIECSTHMFELGFEPVEQAQSSWEVPRRAGVLQLLAELGHPCGPHVAAASFEGVGDAFYRARVSFLHGLSQGRKLWWHVLRIS